MSLYVQVPIQQIADGLTAIGWSSAGGGGDATLSYSATAPSTPTNGTLWYDTTATLLKLYTGGTWTTINVSAETISTIQGYVTSAQSAATTADQKLTEFKAIQVTATTLDVGSSATASFNSGTGVITLGIPTGATGQGLSPKGTDTVANILLKAGALGDYWVASDTGDGYMYDGSVWVNVGAIKGDKGDKGDTGLQGIQGIKGDTGSTGAKGDKGDTGAQGIQGLQGIQGIQGVKGDAGDVSTAQLTTALSAKQDTLVSGTSIKTVNGTSVLGSGDIEITSGAIGPIVIPPTVDYEGAATTLTSVTYNYSAYCIQLDADRELVLLNQQDMFIYNSTTKTRGNLVSAFITTDVLSSNMRYALDGDTIVFFSRTGTASTTLKVVAGTISGTTLTFGSVTSLTVSSNINGLTCAKVGSSYLVVCKTVSSGLEGFALTVSGTTITAGAKTAIASNTDCGTVNVPIEVLTATTVLIAYGNATTTARASVLTVSGTTITVGTAATLTVSSTAYDCFIAGKFSTGRFLFFVASQAAMINVSGTTASFSNIVTSNFSILTSYTDRFNMLQGTTTIAAVFGTSTPQVFTDTSGTLSFVSLTGALSKLYSLKVSDTELILFQDGYCFKVTQSGDVYSYTVINTEFQYTFGVGASSNAFGAPLNYTNFISGSISYSSVLVNGTTFKPISSSRLSTPYLDSVAIVDGNAVSVQLESGLSYYSRKDGACCWSAIQNTSNANNPTFKRFVL